MIPHILHFINIRHNGIPEFGLMHYVAVKSAIQVNNPERVYYHCNIEPEGEYWELIRPLLEIHHTDIPAGIYGNEIFRIEHAVDILKLQILKLYGGIYMDLDTICVKPFDDHLYNYRCVLGLELNPKWSAANHFRKILKALIKIHIQEVADKIINFREHKYVGFCNAIIMAEKDSLFINKWYESYVSFKGDQWNVHSVIMPFRILRKKYKKYLTVLDYKTFYYPSYDTEGLSKLFLEDRNYSFDKAIVHHLWANVSYNSYIRNIDPHKSEGLSYYEKLIKIYI